MMINTTPDPFPPDHTKSGTYGSTSDAQTRSEPISQGDFATTVTSISGMVETAKEALRTGDFLTLMTKLDELGISADGLKRGVESHVATTPTHNANAGRTPKRKGK